MNPAQIILLANSLLSAVEVLIPKISELTKSGEITTDQQNQLLSRIEAIRNGSAFDGPEWKTDEDKK